MSGAASVAAELRDARPGRPAPTDLLLRPERFFENLFASPRPWLTGLLVVVAGVANAEGMIALRLALADAGLGSSVNPAARAGWLPFGLTLLVGGLVGGPLAWLVWGGWYRLRLRFSGVPASDPGRTRTVWVWSEAVWALPTLGLLAMSALNAPDYATASRTGPFALSSIVLPVYSSFVGYRAAIGCFGAQIGRARIWFLALPAAFFGLAVVGGLGLALKQALTG